MLSLFNRRKKDNGCCALQKIMSAIAYFAAGFAVAVLVQHYLKDTFTVPVLAGWALLAAGVILHVYACKKK